MTSGAVRGSCRRMRVYSYNSLQFRGLHKKGVIMTTVKNGDAVQVHYTGKFDDGTVFDSSDGRDPLKFTVGAGQVIPGFDRAVEGMEQGQSKTFTIPCEQAYGESNPNLILKVGKDSMPQDAEVKEGMVLQSKQEDGRMIQFVVAEVGEAEVTLDANHPMAGKDLTFEIELVDLQAAAE